jgi:radical SAM superfamily enzyme YgiQ (UPF0313 family)
MKILLIYPHFLEARLHAEDISVVPIGVYYIAAMLKENHYDVEILNWHNINETPHQIEEVLLEKKPDVIGLSILHANRWGGIEVARIAKRIDSRVQIVFGGIGASFLWEHLLVQFPEIDYVVIGEGEYSFLELIRCLEQGHGNEIGKINGIALRSEGKILKTEDAATICNLDEVPNPARYYQYRHLVLTRGCAWKCSFCGSPQFWGRHVRFHSVDYFVEQIELIYNKGITFFYFCDDTFTINPQRVIELCKTILRKNLNITWAAISRVDNVTEEAIYWMRKAGCIQISYGVESGSEKIRSHLNKNISTAQIKKAFTMTQKYGILARAYFIYGCPQENWSTVQETIDLMNEIKPLSTIFYILDIFPGTELYEDYKKRAGVSDDIWLNRVEDIMYFETDPALNKNLVIAFGEKLRTTFYENLEDYVDSLRLVDKKELYPLHSDFYSRLAMTFDHGDYAHIGFIKGKEKIAQRLYEKALEYNPDPRAFLGLGIHLQKNGAYQKSIDLLRRGLRNFPDDPQLHICRGVSFMNLGHFDKALKHFLKFDNAKEAVRFAAQCYEALGDEGNALLYSKKLEAMQRSS